MGYGKRATWDEIREEPFGDLSDSYTAVGDSITKATRAIKISNYTDETIYFTDDTDKDKLKLPPNSFQLWDITANKTREDLPQFMSVGKYIYARHITQSAPTTGWVSIETLIVENGS